MQKSYLALIAVKIIPIVDCYWVGAVRKNGLGFMMYRVQGGVWVFGG